MVDIENEVYTKVLTAVRADSSFSNITASQVVSYDPAVFPCFYLEETDNYSVTATQDSTHNDNHSVVTYEVNIYSKKKNGSKAECKKIAQIIDSKFNELGFTRVTKQYFNLPDASGCRLFLRYTAIVGADKTIYRR